MSHKGIKFLLFSFLFLGVSLSGFGGIHIGDNFGRSNPGSGSEVDLVPLSDRLDHPLDQDSQVVVIYDAFEKVRFDPYRGVFIAGGESRLESIQEAGAQTVISALSIDEAVEQMKKRALKPDSIDRIFIVDHGGLKNGQPVQTLGEKKLSAKELGKLKPFLKPDGDLCLYGCDVGKNIPYLKKISSRIGGRRVWAYADVLSHNRDQKAPLLDPFENWFIAYPLP